MLIRHSGKYGSFFWFVIAGVIETFITFPCNATEFHINNRLIYFFVRNSIDNDDFIPVASAFRNRVGGKVSFFVERQVGK